jgi:hypothetical protein
MNSLTTIINFKGELTFPIIGQMIQDLKSKREKYEIEMGIFKKLISLMIEILENILKYSEHFSDLIKDNPKLQPEFRISCNSTVYSLNASNPIKKTDINPVKQHIDMINNLSQEEFKIQYRKTIANGEFTEKGGAGLGFFEMVKITGQSIQYRFTDLSEEFLNFELFLNVETN